MFSLETGFSVYVADLDVVSTYPCGMRALNISRMTLTFAPYAISGRNEFDVRSYFSNLINVRENATLLCSKFHGLPDYIDMKAMVKSKLSFDDHRTSQNVIDRFDGEYRFLSNFWYARVSLDGVVYPYVENAYQAAKTQETIRPLQTSRSETLWESSEERTKD